MPFLEKLREGYDMVIGNRFQGGIAPGAMPFSHKYLGNPVLSGIGRLFFNIPIGDFHCGLRGFRKSSILVLNLQTIGMEFASFYNSLGVKVIVVEMLDKILGEMDAELSSVLQDIYQKRGVDINLLSKVTAVDGNTVVFEKDGKTWTQYHYSHNMI